MKYICNCFYYAFILVTASMTPTFAIFGGAKTSYISDYVTNVTQREFVDIFITDNLYLYCNLKVNPQFIFEPYAGALRMKNISDINDPKVTLVHTNDHFLLTIRKVTSAYSGIYMCKNNVDNGRTFWQVTVHDPERFKYVMQVRKQTSGREIEMGDSKIKISWSSWAACDGCAGKGEKRRFGIWNVYTHEGEKFQKENLRNIPFFIKPFAKTARNEILVETCFEPCADDNLRVKVQKPARLFLEEGQDLTLSCPGNQSIHHAIRWEREYTGLLRSVDSYGYALARSFYIGQNNSMQIHKINFKDRDTITMSCTRNRYVKYSFELVGLKEQEIVVTLFEHLRTICLSILLQVATFVFILTITSCARMWADDVSMGRV